LAYTAPHALTNQVLAGLKEGLNEEFPDGGVAIVEKHASGDWAQFGATVDGVISSDVDLMVSITTPISQAALKRAPKSVPLCFLAVTDPVGAGLAESIGKPVKCTGVSDLAPFRKILEFVRQVLPNARSIGYPYNPEDQPAVFGLKEVKRIAPDFGFAVVEKAVTSKDEVFALATELARTNDCLLIGSDNLMFEAAPVLVKAGLLAKTPVFAGDSTSVEAGAVGGYTIDYMQVGREGAKIAATILRGNKAGDIPVKVMSEGVLEVNSDSAAKFGIRIPENLLRCAKVVRQAGR
jgi:putative ABC transport system substrate-binding protein